MNIFILFSQHESAFLKLNINAAFQLRCLNKISITQIVLFIPIQYQTSKNESKKGSTIHTLINFLCKCDKNETFLLIY